VTSAVAEKKTIDIRGLGNDDEICLVIADPSKLRHMGYAGKAAALLVHAATLLHCPLETEPGAANGFDGEDGCGNARLLVGSATSIKLSVLDHRCKRIDRPAFANGDHVEMSVEVQAGTIAGPFHPSQHVQARILFGVLVTAFRRDVVRLVTKLPELAADEFGVYYIVLTRRIYGGNTDEFLQKGDHF
jgi:hypothetical protein